MRRQFTLVGFWLGGTAIAMLLAALAVQMAGAKVTDPRSATVSRRQVESELAQDATSTSTTVPEGAADPGLPTDGHVGVDDSTTVPPGGPSTLPGPGGRPSESTPPSSERPAGPPPSPTTPSAVPTDRGGPPTTHASTTIETHGGPPPTTGPPPPTTTTKPPMSYANYYLVGGMVRVYCVGYQAQIGTSSPAPGYEMQVPAPGPGSNVDVRFSSPTHHSEFKAHCDNGKIVPEIIESNGSSLTPPS